MITVTGSHRSGTTFLGHLLGFSGATIIHEPFNKGFGVDGVPVVYPYISGQDSEYYPLLKDVYEFRPKWNSKYVEGKSKIKNASKSILNVPGKAYLKWNYIKALRGCGLRREVIIKDPFLSLSIGGVLAASKSKIIVIFRHPCAVHHSTTKKQWFFDISNLRRQGELFRAYGHMISSECWGQAAICGATSVAILWKIMFHDVIKHANSDRVMLVRHEDLCIKPEDVLRDVYEFVGKPLPTKLHKNIGRYTQGSRVDASNNATHDFVRDSPGIVDSWRGKLDSVDERRMREILEDEVVQLYGKW